MIDTRRVRLITIGASMGGIKAFEQILSNVDKNFHIPIVCVNHLPVDFDLDWMGKLNDICSLPVNWAQHSQFLKPGEVVFAPPDHHLLLSSMGRLELNQEPPYFKCRPAINYLFDSASEHFGRKALGVLLTGLNHDGTDGLINIQSRQGQVLIQDPAEADSVEMPQAAIHKLKPAAVYSLEEITDIINQIGLGIN